ncbi:hypothetical protein BV20DRAFT_371670 [Pilatotrama ljubarskyi]|nr:hypothetical protein BV20DRAFT_371670 [Pilatotrama ljubarskyi]
MSSERAQTPVTSLDQYLNDDILLHTMSFMDRPSISALMQTCRRFQSRGAKFILKGEVILRSEPRILSFFLFMLADPARRFPLLRSLSIFSSCTPLSLGIADLLRKLFCYLAAAGDLRRLWIFSAEKLLSSHPDLPSAIAQLPALTELLLTSAGPRCSEMLGALRSTLVSFTVAMDHHDYDTLGEDTRSPAEKDPVSLLRRSRRTLDRVTMSFAQISPGGPKFPNVTYLSLEYLDKPWIVDYIRAFPNLEELEVLEWEGYSSSFDDDDIEQHREANCMIQQFYGTWRGLRSYSGSLCDLYLLGLQCHIPHLRIKDGEYGFRAEMLADVLDDARPVHLELGPHRVRLATRRGRLPRVLLQALGGASGDAQAHRELQRR